MRKIKKTPLVLITAGPTRERIDPIRYIQNTSTGKLGIEIAKEAYRRNYQVILIYGPGTSKVPSYIPTVRVESTREMLKEVLKYIKKADVFVCSAAIADYSPEYQNTKIPSGKKILNLKLYPNPKVIKEARKISPKNTIFVAFKLEYNVDEKELLKKARSMDADIVVANDFKKITSTSHPALIIHNKHIIKAKNKKEIAFLIWELISKIKKQRICTKEV